MFAKNSVVSFLCGLSIGAGVALLFAPKSGRRLRSQITHAAREQSEKIMEQASDLRDSATEILEQGRREVQRHKKGLEQAVAGCAEAYNAMVSSHN